MPKKKEETAVALKSPTDIVGQEDINWDDVRKNLWPNLSEKEFKIALGISHAYGLNPFKKEIHAIKYGNNPAQMVVGYETYLKRAERNPNYDGFEISYTEKGDKPVTATCLIRRKDWSKPFQWTVHFNEYNTGKSVWNAMPYFMIKKVAMCQAFRLCFPDDFGGMPYIPEELGKGMGIKEVSEDLDHEEIIDKPTRGRQGEQPVRTIKVPEEEEQEPEPEPEEEPIEPEVIEPEEVEEETQEEEEEPQEEPQEEPEEEITEEFLDEEGVQKIVKAFASHGVTKQVLVNCLQKKATEWTPSMRDWLTDLYFDLEDEKLTVKQMKTMRFKG